MAKTKTCYFCSNCGAQASQWIGRCPSCGEWNSYNEEVVQRASTTTHPKAGMRTVHEPIPINAITTKEQHRIVTSDNELNRVLGGGIVPGAIVLIGGEPGIGKSTLLLQIALSLDSNKVIYVSGEESEQQIKLRADRIGAPHNNCFILTETSVELIIQQTEAHHPAVLIIDSIQTLHTEIIESSPGSISQIKECTAQLQRYAKETNLPVFLIGHITKEGNLAGPKVLEHIVDTVLQFEGDRNHGFRIIRSIKNRFGSTSELGIYEMQQSGLREITNPSEILLSQHEEELSGITISATMEGLRPMLIETQALVSTAAYGTPQRATTGFDGRRLNMLLAVLEKRCGFRMSTRDVFVNIAGGLRIDDPAIDLGVVCAVLSSNEDISIPGDVCFAAEVGLSGEIRPVTRIEQRIAEASKLGFKTIYISKYNMKGLTKDHKIKVIPVAKIDEVFIKLFN